MTNKTLKQPERDEIPEKMTWDTTPLYKNYSEWKSEFEKIDVLLSGFNSFKGKLAESSLTLSKAFKASDALERLLEKIYVFAHLKSDEDTSDSERSGNLDIISVKFAEIQSSCAWFEPELATMPDDVFDRFMNSPELAFYKRTMNEVKKAKPHTLTEKEEKILGSLSDVISTPRKTFSMLNDADMKFPEIELGDGGKQELTHGNYIRFLENPDRNIRKAAFDAMFDTFAGYRNTISSTLSGTIKSHVVSARLRNYPSALQKALFEDNIPVKVYENLISTVKNNLEPLHKYFKLRASVMKLNKLDVYDIYNPLVPESRIEVPWKKACQWVRQALRPMGEEYREILEKAFKDRWIDVLECRGKRSGAYSSGCYDSPPYVLMNYNGTLNDVFTLAHELGHSMHSYYSNHHQDYHYADYRIFVAEVASTTNELLLQDYLMKNSGDKKFTAYLLNHLADQVRGTVYRQTMFAEFEKIIHEKAECSVPLTPDMLSGTYLDLNTFYHGDSVRASEKIRMEWARIPHFYYNFYVYKYATGFSAAVAFSENILSGNNKKIEAYINFLKAGDSKDVLDILKDAGVDLSSPAPIKAALDKFAETLEMLKENLSGD